MAKKMRKCAVCGKNYPFCPRCGEDKDKPMWYFTFCSENCKDIYDVTSKFEDGQISGKDAKTKLDKLDLSNFEDFGNSYKISVAKINETKTEVPLKNKETESLENNNEKACQLSASENETKVRKPKKTKTENSEE